MWSENGGWHTWWKFYLKKRRGGGTLNIHPCKKAIKEAKKSGKQYFQGFHLRNDGKTFQPGTRLWPRTPRSRRRGPGAKSCVSRETSRTFNRQINVFVFLLIFFCYSFYFLFPPISFFFLPISFIFPPITFLSLPFLSFFRLFSSFFIFCLLWSFFPPFSPSFFLQVLISLP